MPTLVIYLLKVSISLSIAWLFYRLVLRPLTFYGANRWYLLGYSLLSFLIPVINIGSMVVDSNKAGRPFYIAYIPAVAGYTLHTAPHAANPGTISPWSGIMLLLAIGMIVLLTRVLIRWFSLARIRRHARLISRDNNICIYQVDRKIVPFSFGNAIYINQRLHTEKEWAEIILHEYVHIRQRHTIDILVAEFICIGNWYNPFAWAIRHAIRQNLEFIADQKVLDNGVDRKGYQYHLLKVAGHPAYALANNFNFSSLKKRIIMMNKVRSTRLHLLRFAFILPLVAVLLVAFRHAPTATRSAGLALQDTVPPAGALWIVDGIEKHYSMKDVLNPQDIASMQVLSPDEGFRLLGDKGRNGVVAIITRAYLNAQTPPHSTATHIISQHAPIYIVNGMQVPKGIDWPSLINPKEITSINVLKDSAATARYGEDGANGVILISTKSFRNP